MFSTSFPIHVIYIFFVEYTYPHTGKLFWSGKGRTYLYQTFPVSYMFGSKNKMLETKFRSSSLNESRCNKYRGQCDSEF